MFLKLFFVGRLGLVGLGIMVDVAVWG